MTAADPVPDDVSYPWSPWRFMCAVALIGLLTATIGWLAASWLISAFAERPGPASVPDGILFIIVYATVYATSSFLLTRRAPARLAFRPAGLELASARRDGVVIPYEVISSARMRWVWPVTVLEVSVDAAAEERVTPLDRRCHNPSRRHTDALVRFSAPLAGLDISAAAFRRQLRERL